MALSNVICKLSQINSKGSPRYINYRDSKLTRILQPALGGNSKTAIICTINQTKENFQESMNTLLFGVKAKRIKNTVQINDIVPEDQQKLLNANKEIDRLKEELKLYKNGSEKIAYEKTADASLKMLKTELVEKNDEINRLKKLLEIVEKPHFIQENDKSGGEIELRNEITKLKIELEDAKKPHILIDQSPILIDSDDNMNEEEILKLKHTIEDLQNEINVLKIENSKLFTENEELQKEKEKYEFHAKSGEIGYNEELVNDWSKLKDEKNTLEKTISEQKIMIQNLITENTLLKAKQLFKKETKPMKNEQPDIIILDSDNEENITTNENTKLLGDVDKLSLELDKSATIIEKQKRELDKINAEYSGMRTQSEQNKREIERLSLELKQVNKNLAEKSMRLELAERERNQFKNDITSYRAECLKLKKDLERKNMKDGSKMITENNQLEIKKLKEEISQLKHENEAFTKNIVECVTSAKKRANTSAKKYDSGYKKRKIEPEVSAFKPKSTNKNSGVFDDNFSKYLFI